MSPSPHFKPFKTQYFDDEHVGGGAGEAEPLNFLIYVPHDGRIEGFLDHHPELSQSSWLTPEQLRDICNMEADRGTRELGEKLAHMLAAQGFRVALMEVLVPREVVDVNRIPECALHPTFDRAKYPKLKETLMAYYEHVIAERKRLIKSLGKHGKWLDLHSMRPFETAMDGKPPPPLDDSSAPSYYKRRIDALNADGVAHSRNHCLVTTYKGQKYATLIDRLLADPVLLDALKTILNKHKIDFNDQTYAFFDHVLGVFEPELYSNGLLIDIDKRALLKGEGKFNLKAEVDGAKIETFAGYLMDALILAYQTSAKNEEMAAK